MLCDDFSEQSEIQSDIEKRSAMSFERSLLKPAFFQPRSAPVHLTWSFKKQLQKITLNGNLNSCNFVNTVAE